MNQMIARQRAFRARSRRVGNVAALILEYEEQSVLASYAIVQGVGLSGKQDSIHEDTSSSHVHFEEDPC
jgi:hypothetical protein